MRYEWQAYPDLAWSFLYGPYWKQEKPPCMDYSYLYAKTPMKNYDYDYDYFFLCKSEYPLF